jgi:hypothetical protein
MCKYSQYSISTALYLLKIINFRKILGIQLLRVITWRFVSIWWKSAQEIWMVVSLIEELRLLIAILTFPATFGVSCEDL